MKPERPTKANKTDAGLIRDVAQRRNLSQIMNPPIQRLVMFGVGLAVGATFAWIVLQAASLTKVKPIQTISARWDIDSLFTDVSLADIYTEPWIHETLLKPDSVTLHRSAPGGAIVYGDFRFLADGTPLSAEDRSIVSRLLRSMTAYQVGLGLTCVYRPGVLLRVQRGHHTIDYPICFGCHVADWYADGVAPTNSVAPRVGFSALSFRILQEIVRDTYPSMNLTQATSPPSRANNGAAPNPRG